MKKLMLLLALSCFSTTILAKTVSLTIKNDTEIKNGWRIYAEKDGRWKYKKRLKEKGSSHQFSVDSPYKIKLESTKKFYHIDASGNVSTKKEKIIKKIEGTDSKTYTIKYEEKVKEIEDDPDTRKDETDRKHYQYPDNYMVESSGSAPTTTATTVASDDTTADTAARYKITINVSGQMPKPKRGRRGWKAKLEANGKWITNWKTLPRKFNKIEKGKRSAKGKPLPSNFTIQLQSKGKYETTAGATQYFTIRKDVSNFSSDTTFTLKIKDGMQGTREDHYELVKE